MTATAGPEARKTAAPDQAPFFTRRDATLPRRIPVTTVARPVAIQRSTPGRLPAEMRMVAASRATVPADRFTIAMETIWSLFQLPGWTRPTLAAATNAASHTRPPVTTHSAP